MADITLEKPKAGEHITVPAHAGARFVIKFDTSEATPKKDGANFIFIFEDDSSITITNFYGQPQSLLPELYWQEELMPAEDFFARLDAEPQEQSGYEATSADYSKNISEEHISEIFLDTLSSDFLAENTFIEKLLHDDELFLHFTATSETKVEYFSKSDFTIPIQLSFDDALHGDSYPQRLNEEPFSQSAHTSKESTVTLPTLDDILYHNTEIPEQLLAFHAEAQEQKKQYFLQEGQISKSAHGDSTHEQGGQNTNVSHNARSMEYTNEETETSILVQQTLTIIT